MPRKINRIKKFKRVMGAIGSVADGALNLVDKGLNVAEKAKKITGYKNGGVVKKTGLAKLHKNEIVLSSSQVKSLKKLINHK